MNKDSKEELVIFVGTHTIGLRYMPQKAIGGALELQASPHQKNTRCISFTTNPVNPIQTVASLSAASESLKIFEFISARLSAAPEESDVVHELLAHLTERIIEMNLKKNAEIKIVEESISGGKDAKETEIAG